MHDQLPDFLHIGASKSGSSWIYEILREHPEIFVPIAKDISFFDHQFDLGLDWYRDHFKAANCLVKGEVAHDYFLERRYAERILDIVPDVRLTVCLREPAARVISRYKYALTTEVTPDTTLETYLERSTAIRESEYVRNLRPFFELFPRENIRVYIFEEIVKAPEAFCTDLYDYLGVDDSFRPEILHRKVRAARSARMPFVARLAWKTAKALRSRGHANWVGAVKRNPIFNRLMYNEKSSHGTVTEDQRRALRDRFAPDVPELEALLGRKVADVWGY